MEIERKVLPLRQFKMLSEGSGGYTAYPSVFGELDNTGDIVLPGSYADDLPDFLKRGFTAHSHDWSYDGVVGYPVAAKEDQYGLYAECRFHSTPDAQAVRTKMAERAAAGLDVLLSIGYQAKQAKFLSPGEYAAELPKVCRPDHLPEALALAAQFPRVRLLSKIKLYEYSVVTVPALSSARTTGVKAMDGKAQYLGEYAEASATLQALRSLNDGLFWNVIYPALYGESDYAKMPMADRVAVMRQAMDEFRDIGCRMVEQMMAGLEGANAEAVAASQAEAKALWPKAADAKELQALTFEKHSEALGTALKEWTERVSWVHELRTKQGRMFSQANLDRMASIRDMMRQSADIMDAMMGDADAEDEAGKASAEAVQQALSRFLAVEARLCGVPV